MLQLLNTKHNLDDVHICGAKDLPIKHNLDDVHMERRICPSVMFNVPMCSTPHSHPVQNLCQQVHRQPKQHKTKMHTATSHRGHTATSHRGHPGGQVAQYNQCSHCCVPAVPRLMRGHIEIVHSLRCHPHHHCCHHCPCSSCISCCCCYCCCCCHKF
jgi:hypothetical protein